MLEVVPASTRDGRAPRRSTDDDEASVVKRSRRPLVAIRRVGQVITTSDTLEYRQLAVGELSSSRHRTSTVIHSNCGKTRRAGAPGQVILESHWTWRQLSCRGRRTRPAWRRLDGYLGRLTTVCAGRRVLQQDAPPHVPPLSDDALSNLSTERGFVIRRRTRMRSAPITSTRGDRTP